jgi:hypothetical protein
MNLSIAPFSYNPGKIPNTIRIGLLPKVFTMASFYRTLTVPAQETLRTTVHYAMIYPRLSLAVGWCEKPLRERTPTFHHNFWGREAATVSRTSHILENHVKRDKVRIRFKDCGYRLEVALLAKVGCRGLSPLLNHTATLLNGAQA